MIVVTGATGRVGRPVIAELRKRDLPVRAVSRNPGLLPPGAEAVRGDLAVPARWSRT